MNPTAADQIKADAERITNRRLAEAAEAQGSNDKADAELYGPHPAPAEQKITKGVIVAERAEAVTEPVSADSAVNDSSVKDLKKKV